MLTTMLILTIKVNFSHHFMVEHYLGFQSQNLHKSLPQNTQLILLYLLVLLLKHVRLEKAELRFRSNELLLLLIKIQKRLVLLHICNWGNQQSFEIFLPLQVQRHHELRSTRVIVLLQDRLNSMFNLFPWFLVVSHTMR
mgnify:CR=1 FL=1